MSDPYDCHMDDIRYCHISFLSEMKKGYFGAKRSFRDNEIWILFFFFFFYFFFFLLVKCSSEKGGRVERGVRSVTDCEQSIEITHYLRTSLKYGFFRLELLYNSIKIF